ncbi:MAG TPA: CHASE2 domain-containing protein, partial [Nevskiales bacterium]|nr:CHASE2 domain-containing protein [Nevskiales bacterium]
MLLLFLLHGFGVLSWGLLVQVENFFYDARVRLTMPNRVDQRVVIVDIDERSLAVEGQWPWPRDRLARLLDELFDHYGVQVVGFDVVFPEPDKTGVLIERLLQELQTDPAAAPAAARLAARQPDARFAEAL